MNSRSRAPLVRGLVGLLVVLTVGTSIPAAPPTVTSVAPRAVRPGESVNVTLRGAGLNAAPRLWTSSGCSVELAADVKDNGTKANEVTFRVTAPANEPVAIHGLRVSTAGGVSAPVLFAVDDLPSIAQQAGNITRDKAQVLSLPAGVDGQLAALSLNYYKFQVTAGQRLSVEVLSRRLGSPLDPMIRLLDANGRELEYSDDVSGLRSDSRLHHVFQQAGEYYVEVRDISYKGGGNHFYRLRVGDFPCVSTTYPMGAKRGTTAELTFAGEQIEQVAKVSVPVPTDPARQWLHVGARRAGGNSSGFATLALSDRDELVEAEPNDDIAKATAFTLGQNLNGRCDRAADFDQPSDVDYFVFNAKKGEAWVFRATTRRQGSPTSLSLRVLDKAGKQLAIREDFGAEIADLAHTFPADGEYILAVRDLHGHGGSAFAYRVETFKSSPGFTLSVAQNTLNVNATGTVAATVNVARKGYNGAIELSARNLPAGATSNRAVIGPGQNLGVLTISGLKDAAAGAAAPALIVGVARIGEADVNVVASTATTLKASYGELPWAPLSIEQDVAVAIMPAAAYGLTVDKTELVFGKGLKASVKVSAVRAKDFAEQVALALNPAKGGLPKGVTATVKPIPKGQNEVEIVYSADANAPLGEFTSVLTGTGKQGKATITQSVPGVVLKLEEPFSLTVDAQGGKLKKGAGAKLKVSVVRNPAFADAIEISLQKLPKGVTAAKAVIPKDKNEIEVELKAAGDAAVGAAQGIVVTGNATVGKTKLTASAPALQLEVQE